MGVPGGSGSPGWSWGVCACAAAEVFELAAHMPSADAEPSIVLSSIHIHKVVISMSEICVPCALLSCRREHDQEQLHSGFWWLLGALGYLVAVSALQPAPNVPSTKVVRLLLLRYAYDRQYVSRCTVAIFPWLGTRDFEQVLFIAVPRVSSRNAGYCRLIY